MRVWKVCPILLAVTLQLLGQPPSAPTCRGTVVDAHGAAVAGAEISQFWLAGSHTPSGFRSYGASHSNGDGTFQIKLNNIPTTLFVMDSAGQQGAIVPISQAGGDIRIQLQALWRVHYRFEGPGLTDLSQSRITLKPLLGTMFSQIVGPTEGAISLPHGKYVLAISSPGAEQTDVNLDVTDHDLALDPIPLAAGIARYYGHPAPSLTEVVPVTNASFSIEKLHGKWVLVYFWGYWCAPCVNEGLPKLEQFYEQHLRDRGRFEILAVHENGVAGQITSEELTEKLAGLAEQKWGKPLQIPIVLDRSGQTIKTWGISAYPTMALITPTGDLMRGDLETLRQELDRR